LQFTAQKRKEPKQTILKKSKKLKTEKKQIAIYLVGKVIEIERLAIEKTRKDGERATNIIPHCYIKKYWWYH
jgi:hypothetical protein